MFTTKKLQNYGNAKMIAHMGGKGIAPENSIPAFIASANRSFWGIETDVHITKDRRVIVIHDDNAIRVTGVDINVEESTFSELRKIKIYDLDGVSTKDYLYLPSLEEYIDICKKYGKIAVLELKNKMEPEDVSMIYDIIQSLGYNENTVYISFAIDNLHVIRKNNAGQKVQYLIGKEVPDNLVETITKYNYDLDIHYSAITKELVDACHKNGLSINAWTVDEVEEAENLINIGVDYITSDIIE